MFPTPNRSPSRREGRASPDLPEGSPLQPRPAPYPSSSSVPTEAPQSLGARMLTLTEPEHRRGQGVVNSGKPAGTAAAGGRGTAGTGTLWTATRLEQEHWGEQATSLPAGRRAGKARGMGGGEHTYLRAPQPGWALAPMGSLTGAAQPGGGADPGGRPAGRQASAPLGCREKGRDRRFEWRGRGGGVPRPQTERVGCWSQAEGCVPRLQENRAESARGAGRMGAGGRRHRNRGHGG